MLENIGAHCQTVDQASSRREPQSSPRYSLATVHGDLHDIGKNIVTLCRHQRIRGQGPWHRCAGQKPYRESANSSRTRWSVRISTLAFELDEGDDRGNQSAGLRDKLKIMIGGGQVERNCTKLTGADASELTPWTLCRCARAGMGLPHDRSQTYVRRRQRKAGLRRALAAHHGLRKPEAGQTACRPR